MGDEHDDDQGGFSIAVTEEGDLLVVAVVGELDVATSAVLRGRLAGLADDGARDVMVDLADISFVDSVGLGTLVGALKHQRQNGGNLCLRSPSAPVLKVLEITGLTKVLTVQN